MAPSCGSEFCRPAAARFFWRLRFFVVLAAAAFQPASGWAIDLVGVAQTAALDQPRINLMLSTAPGAPLFSERLDLDDLAAGLVEVLPTVNIQAYFDTGASGILISEYSAGAFGVQVAQANSQPVKFFDVGVGTEAETEFHVSQPLYVGLAPYHPFVNVDTPASYTQLPVAQLPVAMRAQVGPVIRPNNPTDPIDDVLNQILQLLTQQDINVVGMPAMAGKAVVIDPRHTNNTAVLLAGGEEVLDEIVSGDLQGLVNFLNQLELRTYVYEPNTPFQQATADTDPGIPATSHHIKLSYGDFDRFTRLDPVEGPGPTLVHNPFIGPNPVLQLQQNPPVDNTPMVKIGYTATGQQTHFTEGSFLLDTGAAASMISTEIAGDLHVRYAAGTQGTANPVLELFDPQNGTSLGNVSNQFTLTIGGVGGQITVAGFFLDSLLLRTMEGNPLDDNDPNHLQFFDAPVLVHDIALQDPLTNDVLTLDGILGMNFLVASVNILGFDQFGFPVTGDYTPGAFDWLVFNETLGVLGLNLTGSGPVSGDFNRDGQLTGADIQNMLQALANIHAYKAEHGLTQSDLLAIGDLDQSGALTNADLQALLNLLAGGGSGAHGVPEPAALMLFVLALPAWLVAARTKRAGS